MAGQGFKGDWDEMQGWESSSRHPGDPVRPAALAEPDLEHYTIRLPV
jgi:hypothetical protein